jgi:hypothetical protein
MRTIIALLLVLTVVPGFADDAKKSDKKTEKKAKPAAKSDKNAAQKAEASIGKWANDNKIWITHPDKKKSEK